jgi:hypothetical protein
MQEYKNLFEELKLNEHFITFNLSKNYDIWSENIEIINSNEIIIDTKSMNNSVYIIKYFNEKEVFTSKFEVLK